MNAQFDPALGAFIISALGVVLGFLGYRRSQKVDKVAEETGSIQQVINGLKDQSALLQSDNKDLRADVARLEAKVDALEAEIVRLNKLIAGQPAT